MGNNYLDKTPYRVRYLIQMNMTEPPFEYVPEKEFDTPTAAQNWALGAMGIHGNAILRAEVVKVNYETIEDFTERVNKQQ